MASKLRKKAAQPYLQPMMTAIQQAMRERKLDIKGLCDALGISIDKRPAVYNWVSGKNGPSEQYRAKLAQVLGLTEAQLTAPTKSGQHTKQLLGPAQRAVALVAAQAAQPMPTTTLAEPVRDVFSITGRSDGQIAVNVRATLDAKRGMVLARFLLDFGLVMGDEDQVDE